MPGRTCTSRARRKLRYTPAPPYKAWITRPGSAAAMRALRSAAALALCAVLLLGSGAVLAVSAASNRLTPHRSRERRAGQRGATAGPGAGRATRARAPEWAPADAEFGLPSRVRTHEHACTPYTDSSCSSASRVIRGPDWNHDDEDGGDAADSIGTVTGPDPNGPSAGYCLVSWDNGATGLNYRVGVDGYFELCLSTAGPTLSELQSTLPPHCKVTGALQQLGVWLGEPLIHCMRTIVRAGPREPILKATAICPPHCPRQRGSARALVSMADIATR